MKHLFCFLLIGCLSLLSVPASASDSNSKVIEIKLSAIGDCTIGQDLSKINSKNAYTSVSPDDLSYYFKKVVDVFSQDDLTIANCETTFTDSEIKRKKTDNPAFHFKSPPQFAEVFKLGSVDFVNLANNHTYDYSNNGFSDTKTNLDKFDIKHFGGDEISYFRKDGITIALLGYNLLCQDYKVKGKEIVKTITEVSKKSDIQIISLHWGKEKLKKPTDQQVWLAHYLIDNGADLILGHHPHVIEPIEVYKDKVINYSLANFSYGGHIKPQPETYIFQQTFKFQNNKLISSDWNIIPCLMYSGKINNYQPIVAESKKALEIKKFLYPKLVEGGEIK